MVAANVDNPALTAATRLATRWRPPAFVSGEGAGYARASAPSTTRTVRQTGRFSALLGPRGSASPPVLERAGRSPR